MSCLSDSDESDDDFLFEERAFAKPEPVKQKKTPLNILQRMASGKQTEPQQSTQQPTRRKRTRTNKKQTKETKPKKAKPSKYETLRAERQKDPKWIEQQARKTVDEELRLDVVDKITDLNDIGWYRFDAKKGKKTEYYPAIISQNKAEADILLKEKCKKNYKTIKIQYVGVDWKDALKHQEIALSKWIPYSKGNDSENEERLQNFVKAISKTSRLKGNPLELKIEEFAIRKMWEKVKLQNEKRQLDKEKDRADALQSALLEPLGPSISAETVTQDSDNSSQCNEGENDEDSDSPFSDDEESLASPGKRRTKRSALRVNDEIEYYEMGNTGNPAFLRRAKIIGISPNESFPLLLSNTIMPLPSTDCVRRLPDGFWQPIHDFVLLQEGVQSLTGSGSALDTAKKKIRKVQSEIALARDKFWKDEHGASATEQNAEDQDEAKDNCDVTNDGDVRIRRSRRSAVCGKSI